MQNELYWVWLCSDVNLARNKVARLLERLGGPREIYDAGRGHYEGMAGFARDDIDRLCRKDLKKAEGILKDCQRLDQTILTPDYKSFPERLLNIYSVPYVLYVRGKLPPIDQSACISVVGSRTATAYGMSAAEKLSFELARAGAVVVSGMARGIDSMAHKGALAGGGHTVAVLGCGADVAYPSENRPLMEEIIKSGAVISEYPPGTGPSSSHFPARNRIISGLSLGTLVIEAHIKSGSLITAGLALEQGRDIFAVPGAMGDKNSAGSNRLIKQGARLVDCVDDILEEYRGFYGYRLVPPKSPAPVEIGIAPAQRSPVKREEDGAVQPKKELTAPSVPDGLSQNEKKLFLLLCDGPTTADEAARRLSIPINELNAALSLLEIEGHIIQLPGRRLMLNR